MAASLTDLSTIVFTSSSYLCKFKANKSASVVSSLISNLT